ncbi:hypothetical protein ACEZDB_32205 [Streptacidiphilus sp. N1-3]|uniref:Uncharacterized protein n=1 Tax=Streptacidiphilus alkalitolerans TaxID=3342712 RepID=A0ABV6XB75_9ACTN
MNTEDDWSPADNPYAIAVSEGQWWQRAAILAVRRMRDEDDSLGGFSTHQIDARSLVFALRQILTAVELERTALKELGIPMAVRDELVRARDRFTAAFPGITEMRDGLTHFDEWSRGTGKGPQKKRHEETNEALRDVARHFWGFGYDPQTGVVSMGPYRLDLSKVEKAATEMSHAIYMAAHAVDQRNAAELHARTIEVLADSGLGCNDDGPILVFSDGVHVGLALRLGEVSDEQERTALASKLVAAAAAGGLRATSTMYPDAEDTAERLAAGEQLRIELVLTA